MGRPRKPYAVLTREGKSHRTKNELEERKKAEEAFATGVQMKERREVKQSLIAHKEFLRITKLLKSIGKNDAIYEGVINRYCQLYSECYALEEQREQFCRDMTEMEAQRREMLDEGSISKGEYYRLKSQMQKNMLDVDKQVQAKRKMMMDIEKENAMTIAAAMRSIPKVDTAGENPLLEVLRGG